MNSRKVVLDTETTGRSLDAGHRIIEIGCIELNNRIFSDRNFHSYVNPERDIEEGALAVHGITVEFLQDKPRFSEIAPKLYEFLYGAELIIHNAPFDLGYLNMEFSQLSKKYQPLENVCTITDTLVMARRMHPGQRNSLDALCKRYNVDLTDRKFHGALLDARLLAAVYLAMTGGQTVLFTDVENTTHTHTQQPIFTTDKIQYDNLKVIRATAEELVQHNLLVEKINAASEQGCLFMKLDEN